MERSMKQYDKEYMKTAMLKHEQTFREQVSELHRLYQVQKMLMRDLKRSALKRPETYGHRSDGGLDLDGWRDGGELSSFRGHGALVRPRRALDLERPAEEYAEADDGDNTASDVEDENEIELTLALATGRRRRKKEESLTSDSGASFSSSSTESGEESLKLQNWGLLRFSGMNGSFPGVKKNDKSGDFSLGSMRQDALKQPPWLLQCLSLNMT